MGAQWMPREGDRLTAWAADGRELSAWTVRTVAPLNGDGRISLVVTRADSEPESN